MHCDCGIGSPLGRKAATRDGPARVQEEQAEEGSPALPLCLHGT